MVGWAPQWRALGSVVRVHVCRETLPLRTVWVRDALRGCTKRPWHACACSATVGMMSYHSLMDANGSLRRTAQQLCALIVTCCESAGDAMV